MLEIHFIIFLIAKLTTVLSRKYKDNKELEKDYKFIRDESRSMQAFLKNMKAKQDAGGLDDEQIEWYKQVKELSYDTERLINKYLSRSAYRRNPILRLLFSVMKYPADQNDFLSKMRDIKSRAVQIKERHERYKSINDKSNKISKHPIQAPPNAHPTRLLYHTSRGKKCYMLSARDINIAQVDTPKYWTWISLAESRFKEVAKLIDVGRLAICGKITTDKLSPNITYVAYLVFFSKSKLSGFDHTLVKASFGISGQADKKTSRVCLDPVGTRKKDTKKLGYVVFAVKRDKSWSEIKLGEFHVDGKEIVELEMNLEVDLKRKKSGLIIEGIEIRPKHAKPNDYT